MFNCIKFDSILRLENKQINITEASLGYKCLSYANEEFKYRRIIEILIKLDKFTTYYFDYFNQSMKVSVSNNVQILNNNFQNIYLNSLNIGNEVKSPVFVPKYDLELYAEYNLQSAGSIFKEKIIEEEEKSGYYIKLEDNAHILVNNFCLLKMNKFKFEE